MQSLTDIILIAAEKTSVLRFLLQVTGQPFGITQIIAEASMIFHVNQAVVVLRQGFFYTECEKYSRLRKKAALEKWWSHEGGLSHQWFHCSWMIWCAQLDR